MGVCRIVGCEWVDPAGSARVFHVLLAAANSGAVCHRTVPTVAGRSLGFLGLVVCLCIGVCVCVCVCVCVFVWVFAIVSE